MDRGTKMDILHTSLLWLQKVIFAIYMLKANVEAWWANAKRMIEDSRTPITWEVFKAALYSKCTRPKEDTSWKRMVS